MEMYELVNMMSILGVIASIISVVVSLVAMAISILFYLLGKKESKEISAKTQEIASQTKVLETVTSTLLTTSFAMIRENSQAMQKYLFDSVGTTNESDDDGFSISLGNGITKREDRQEADGMKERRQKVKKVVQMGDEYSL